MAKGIIFGIIGAGIVWMCISVFSAPASMDGIFQYIGACVMAAIYLGVLFVVYVLPAISHKVASSMLGDSNLEAEQDPMHDARALVAQGEYQDAIIAYREVAEKDPYNRMPWVDIAKIYETHLDAPDMALAALQEGVQSHEWPIEDAAFFLFRIAEMQEAMPDQQAAYKETLNLIVETFPETRHSANAMHLLRKAQG